MGVTRFNDQTPDQLRKIVDDGTASFKVFLAYKGAFGVDDSELYHTLALAKHFHFDCVPDEDQSSLTATLHLDEPRART
jgi:dihydropyrimidinase